MNTNASNPVSHSPSTVATPVETMSSSIEPVLTLAEIAAHLGVNVQALYDLRNKGRGPRGFKVGRRLHFRVSEVDAWLRHLEAEDSCPAAAPSPFSPVRPLTVVSDPSPTQAQVTVQPVEEPRQELDGDQWALGLDVPRRP